LALLDGVLNVAFGWAELLFKASSPIPPILLDFAVFCGGALGFAAEVAVLLFAALCFAVLLAAAAIWA
jgi:hypothetical protein